MSIQPGIDDSNLWQSPGPAGSRRQAADEARAIQAVVGDLIGRSEADVPLLDAARSAVAGAVAAGQRQIILGGIGGDMLGAAGWPWPGQTQAVPGRVPLVLRRDVPLQPLAGPGELPPWAAGRAADTIGPLTGALGQPVFIDVFSPLPTTMLRRAAAASPFLVISGSAPEWDGIGRGQFGQASAWIAASLFDPAVSAATWIGITAESGVISGAVPTPGPDGVLVIPDSATLTVELELAAPAAPGGSGPGEDSRQADVRLPARASLVLAPAGGTVADLGDALVTAYGTTIRLSGIAGPPRFVPALGSLLLPMRPDPDHWEPAAHASTLVALGGGGSISEAGWAVPVTAADPATLGAAGAGGLALQVSDLTFTLPAQRAIPMSAAWLLAQPELLTIAADAAVGTGFKEQVTLYPDSGGGSRVGGRASIRFADSFPLRYLSSSAGSEVVFARAALDVSLDRPVSSAGARTPLGSSAGVFGLVQDAGGTTLLLEGPADLSLQQPLSLALDNALLDVGAPERFGIRATVTSDSPQLEALTGTATVVFPLNRALPTLPDPYASTVTPAGRPETGTRLGARGTAMAASSAAGRLSLQGRVDWDASAGPATPGLAFSLLGAPTATLPQASSSADVTAGQPATTLARELAPSADTDDQLLAALTAMAEEAAGSVPGSIALLDVSTAADQFGVRYGVARDPGEAAASVSGPAIEGLSVVAPAHTIRVITLPAVQWEPVSGPGPSGTFSPMAFPDSGGETELASRSVRLVPVAPKPAIKQMISDYRQEPTPAGAVASITFPFGIRAVALLDPPVSPRLPAAQLDLHRPGFPSKDVAGGLQLRAAAEPAVPRPKAGPLSLRGAAVQLSNGLHNGVPTGLSPIDPLTGIFNGDFAPGGLRPQVPVERFELSGYGESLFSDWKDETDQVAAVSEVRFDVLAGRASVEVIQARSILYPYAVRVIRDIKMLRDNAGRVQRTDSGWQAVTDGRYRWPQTDTRTHPGAVLGVTNVTNIRDTGQRWTSSANPGTELMAVRFDCMVDLDGVLTGAGPSGVPSHDQLGFVQISINPQPGMTAPEFAELIAAFGPLGGTVDALIDIGGSGQRTRVTHVGTGVTAGTTGPEFVMSAWGSPALPRGGPWSVVRRASGDPAPGPVDHTLGVPLVRAGYAGTAPDPSSPYRFADPADLANPDTPAADYALMHATNTQRVLFPRPKVELTGPRANQISSTQLPLLADPLLMTTAVASFPPVATAIRFPDADYGLRPLGGGDLELDLAHNDFQVTGGDRVIHTAGGNTFFARYRDEAGAPATVHLEIDSSKPVSWAFKIGGVALGLAASPFGDVIRFLGTIDASAAQPGRFTDGTIHFGSALSAIKVFTDFLGNNPLADLPLGSRNQPSFTIGRKIPIVGGPGEPPEIDVGFGTLADADVTIGVKIDLATGAPSLKFELEGIITGRTPWPPLVAAGQVKFEIDSGASGNEYKFTLGFGVGVQFDVGPFKAEAYFFQNNYFVVETMAIGLGIGLELKGSIDLQIATAEIDVEAAALIVATTCPPTPGTTLWLVGQLTIGVDVNIAWVIDIDFEYQMQLSLNLNGGPCPAPLV